MALIAYYDLELHQINIKTAFLNGNLEEDVIWTNQWGSLKKERTHGV